MSNRVAHVRPGAGLRLAATLAAVLGLAASPPASPDPSRPSRADLESVPVLAYYYIWYDTGSWNRAKTDYPMLGRYSSDDDEVMRQHVRWAKAAGIDGFLVSWKSTALLDSRLERLMRVANEHDFKLGIVYQGLDFNREPRGTELIAEDLDRFLAEYADDPVWDLYDEPLVVLAGSWRFTSAEIEDMTSRRKDRLLILGTERDVEGVERLAEVLEGNAYYWASVNPTTNPTHHDKLRAMSDAVHDAGGMWIPPAAPGFDARLVGGTSVVERLDGRTLDLELDAAIRSLPDAIGLISWNEFSENTHIEPSVEHGDRYVRQLASLQRLPGPDLAGVDSSEPEGLDVDPLSRLLALVLVAGLAVAGFAATARRAGPQP